MQSVIDTLELRAAEIRLFIQFLRRVQRPTAMRSLGFGAGDGEFVPMLKACVFIMLYNMIESSVRAGFSSVYGDIQHNNVSFGQTTTDVQRIWLMQQLDSRTPLTSANRDTYLNAFISIAGRIATSSPIDLDSRELPISGNLNASQIRELCRKHGVDLRVSIWAKGGAELDTIKAKRNGLAHGDISFVECGREYAVDDLDRMSKQTRHFLRGVLGSLHRYSMGKNYRAQ